MLSLKNASLNLGSTVLLDAVNLTIERGERVCLVGRNGTGKSSLMKVLTGEYALDAGEVLRNTGLRVAQMPQDVPRALVGDAESTVRAVIARGFGKVGEAVAEYHALLAQPEPDMKRLAQVQTVLEAGDGWALDSRVETVLSQLQLPADMPFSGLSGGLKRRALLGQSLVSQPDLLLLDEPTNHLDIDSIAWIEEFLLNWSGALLFVTHDRAFLRRLATRIIELDRGHLKSWPGSYDDYLRYKADALHAEAQQNALFDKRLAQEEAWIRRGIEARRTRDQGRVKRLLQMREEFAQRRNLQGTAKLSMQEADRSGKLVAETQQLSFSRGDKLIIRELTTTILRGDKIGIIGPNGAGKTTLLKLLLGQLEPTSGSLKTGTNLQVAYFDQLRAQIDDDKPVFENIGDGKDFVEVDGKRTHVMTYLQNFLFTPDRARSPAKALSGGERARLLLARLFSQPSNLIVLDEPTNDLDVETLDLLEELLVDYSGTVWLVSHDRDFIDRVVTRSLVFEGNGRIGDYVGGYSDWLRQRREVRAASTAPAKSENKSTPAPAAKPASKLSYKDKRELDMLPGKIEKLEAEQAELSAKLSDASFYQKERDKALAVQQRLAAIDEELAAAYARWEALDGQA